MTAKNMLGLAAAFLFALITLTPAIAQFDEPPPIPRGEVDYDVYMAQMEEYKQREADALAALDECEKNRDMLRAEVADLEQQVADAWAALYAEMGITEADIDDFAARLDDFERRLHAFGTLSPEEMYQRQDELDALEDELDMLASEPTAKLTRFWTRIQADYREIDSYRNRMRGPRNIMYTVKRGDHLWGISAMPDHFNDGAKWMRIYSVNREKINDPDLIYPQQQFLIPLELEQGQYLVKHGDYLAKISEQIYGDPFQWRKLYEANKELIPSPDMLYNNTILQVPGRDKMQER